MDIIEIHLEYLQIRNIKIKNDNEWILLNDKTESQKLFVYQFFFVVDFFIFVLFTLNFHEFIFSFYFSFHFPYFFLFNFLFYFIFYFYQI